MKTRIKRLNIDENKRILAISDIHGHYNHLTNLLDKINFSKDDVLIILGDIIDKGPMSLKTVRYLMDLCKTDNVYPIMGNVDAHRMKMLDDATPLGLETLYNYIMKSKKQWGSCLFAEMCQELKLDLTTLDHTWAVREAIKSQFASEINFLCNLPTIIETREYIFVHGGVPSDEVYKFEGVDAFQFMKNDAFMEKGYKFGKYVIVGHWPVTLYDGRVASSNPVMDHQRRIISIDGGCGLKRDGQLNALIISNREKEKFRFEAYDSFPVAFAKSHQSGSKDSINIRYTDNQISLIEEGEEFSLAKHKSSGRILQIYNDYIFKKGDAVMCDDYSDYLLTVGVGDKLSIVAETSKGYMVKKDGISGWYQGQIEFKET